MPIPTRVIRNVLKKIGIAFAIIVLLALIADRIIIPGIKQTMERITITKSDLELLQYRNLELGKTIGRTAMMEWLAEHSGDTVRLELEILHYMKYEDKRTKEILDERGQGYE